MQTFSALMRAAHLHISTRTTSKPATVDRVARAFAVLAVVVASAAGTAGGCATADVDTLCDGGPCEITRDASDDVAELGDVSPTDVSDDSATDTAEQDTVEQDTVEQDTAVDTTIGTGDFGDPCTSPDDCASGFCIPSATGSSSFCTVECDGTCDVGGFSCEEIRYPSGTVVNLCVQAEDACGAAAECALGEFEEDSIQCGACVTSLQTRSRSCEPATCTWGEWSDYSECSGGSCDAGAVQTEMQACGACGEGTQSRTSTCSADSCAYGAWSDWGACESAGPCSPGQTDTADSACGECGEGVQTSIRTCDDVTCQWGEFGTPTACAETGICSPGQTDTATEACGNCNAGSRARSRSCNNATCEWAGWDPWAACAGGGLCAPGATRNQGSCDPCGQEVCSATCTWGGCTPINSVASGGCLYNAGSQFRCCDPAGAATSGWQFCLSGTCRYSTDCEAHFCN